MEYYKILTMKWAIKPGKKHGGALNAYHLSEKEQQQSDELYILYGSNYMPLWKRIKTMDIVKRLIVARIYMMVGG